MSAQSTDTYLLELCRGARTGQCPHALPVPNDLEDSIAAAVESSNWPAFLNSACAPRTPRHHELFRISIAACANGCSRPHIADIGVIFAELPATPASCAGCGACVGACPDQALEMSLAGQPVLDAKECLACGKCVVACPEGSMRVAESGCRFLLGGKLGRRPRLAAELPGLVDPAALPERVAGWLAVYMAGYEPGSRFAEVVERIGLHRLLCAVAREDCSTAMARYPRSEA